MLLTVVASPVRSANAPVFVQTHRTVPVLENFRVGQMVELVQASDPDGDRVWYSITGEWVGMDRRKFWIRGVLFGRMDWVRNKV